MKAPLIISNKSKGENVLHAWNSDESFYIFTQRGRRGIESAHTQLNKEFGKIYLNIAHSAHKNQITHYFS